MNWTPISSARAWRASSKSHTRTSPCRKPCATASTTEKGLALKRGPVLEVQNGSIMVFAMSDYTVKNMPEVLRARLEGEAERSFRSMNQEILYRLQRSFDVKAFPNWLVFYRSGKGQIEFLRVKHGMMHLPGLFVGERGLDD